MRLLMSLIILLGLLSCSKPPDNKSTIQTDSISIPNTDSISPLEFDYEGQFKLENYLTSDKFDNADTIDFDCAILIYPTDKQIEEMIKTEGEEDFYVGADDSNWYQGQSIGMIDSVGIRKITASGQYLRLQGQTKSWNLDIRKKNLPAWNLIFFKRNKEPQVISTIDLTVDQVKDYFGD